MNDVHFMRRAMQLALRAKGRTTPNPMVGAVIVKGKKIIAEGWHKYCGADHAEVMALKKAGTQAQRAKLYVTLEPCSHFGRTPPCLDKIIMSGIREVIIGMKDPNPVNDGKSIAVLNKNRIKTKVGLLKNELRKMNEVFVKYIQERTPFVVAKCAQTLDGKSATSSGQSRWITSPSSRDFSHRLRNQFDAILVGVNTVIQDNPYLNAPKSSKRLKKIIVDSTLRMPLDARIFERTKPEDIYVATTSQARKRRLNQLKKKGVNVLVCPHDRGGVELKWLFKELAKKEIASILIEGGARVIGSALRKKLVDKFVIFIAPKIMGDKEALGSIEGLSTAHVDRSIQLKDLEIRRIKGDIFIEAYPRYGG